MGFCFFNNVAVAAAHARAVYGAERVMIVDWDVHHGNGTNDIFHADPACCSPRSTSGRCIRARARRTMSGAGRERDSPSTCRSRRLGRRAVLLTGGARGRAPGACLAPQLVLVSAGFDAHRADPLAGCRVTEAGYAAMTASLRRACAEVGAPLGFVLEGGYSVAALAGSVAALMPVLGAADVPDPVDAARAAAGRLGVGAARALVAEPAAHFGTMWRT